MTTATAPGRVVASTPGASGMAARVPGRDELIDAIAIIVLTVIGIVGFRAAYGGTDYLIAGAVGVVLAVSISYLGQRARVPLLGIIAIGVLAFALLGGLISVALPGGPGSGSGAVPTPQVVHDVLATAVDGWKQLLTTAEPVGSASHLLVIPFLLGLASGVAAHTLASRTRLVLLPAVPPAGVVAFSILFGATHATAAVLQGAGFAAICLAWAAARQQRGGYRATTIGRQRPWQRIILGVAVLAVAAGGATVIGPRLPGAHAHQRVVLTSVPPFNVDSYPSPLDGFRNYTKGAVPGVGLYGQELLSTTGLPPDSRVRIAVMDAYDGVAWGVANAQASSTTFGGFQRVGATLPSGGYGTAAPAVTGPVRTATFTIGGKYPLPWLPDLAGATAITFAGMTGQTVQAAFRFNVATGTGVVPDGVPVGLTYTVTAGPAAPTADQVPNATPFGSPGPGIVIPAAVTAFANAHGGGGGDPMSRMRALAGYLKANGHYSDGGSGQDKELPGHSAGRLTTFLGSDLTGDDEQYAAAMALLANAVGVPARVALDGTTEADGSVHGRDVHADVELDLANYGWVTLPVTDFLGTRKQVPLPANKPQPQPVKAVPQPEQVVVPVSGNNEGDAQSRAVPPKPPNGGFRLPAIVGTLLVDVGIPLVAVAAIAAALIGAKNMRRRRRRERGPAAARVAGAWRELVDLGRDMGVRPDPRLTRREQAAVYAAPRNGGTPTAPDVARAADAAISGPGDPSPEAAGMVWYGTAQPGRTALPALPAWWGAWGGMPTAPGVARAADAAIFGPGDPSPEAVARVWALATEARRTAFTALPAWQRAWVAVNPASLAAGLTGLSPRATALPPPPARATARPRDAVPAG
jgi:hypothetical protein